MRKLKSYFLILFFSMSIYGLACTNLIVTKGASTDGSVMLTYAADSHTLYGELYHWPAATYPKGTKLKVYEWDTGKFLGEINQVEKTYSVVGNINQNQVSIGETTFTGREECIDSTSLIDYGSLIYIALQRSRTAREAIEIMTNLVATYGYYSSGESFSIIDKNEAWILEMMGKGPGGKGAVWVAQRIPDGYVSAHANQARITTINFDDKANCLYAPDVIEYARKNGWHTGTDADFSFSDTYAPLDYGALRFSEARAWSFFNKVNPSFGKQYLPYILGESQTRMPLYIKPDKKISVRDLQNYMRDHYEDTPLDMTKDPGAGPYNLPYRWRPLTWKVDSVTYFNERAIATQQTGFSFVSQLRSQYPDPIGGIHWFGVDDAASSVYVPIYCGITEIPDCFKVGNGSMLKFSWTSAFWIFNWVSNMTYQRYSDMIVEVAMKQKTIEDGFEKIIPETDKKAIALYAQNKAKGIAFISNFSVTQSQETFAQWKTLGEYLMVKYMDGNIKIEKDGKFIDNGYGEAAFPKQPGYSKEFYRIITEKSGDKLKMKGDLKH